MNKYKNKWNQNKMTTQEDGEWRRLLDQHVGTGLTTIDGKATFCDDQFVEQGVFVVLLAAEGVH